MLNLEVYGDVAASAVLLFVFGLQLILLPSCLPNVSTRLSRSRFTITLFAGKSLGFHT